VSTRELPLVHTITLVTHVFLSKTDALAVLREALGAPWNTDDSGDVTLPLGQGGFLSIEVPKFGEDLPLTLDLHHSDANQLQAIADSVTATLGRTLGWSLHQIPRAEGG
jgi:hypothetical protein